jgi:hypothetical protein
MMKQPIPSQEDADLNKPDEHFAWALRALPTFAGSGMLAMSGFFRTWSKHLWECGFVHRDYLVRLADEHGNIHVSKLPQQLIRFQEPFRGPHHSYNPAGRWVRVGEQDPEPVRIPNVRDMTIQEREATLYQFKELGYLPEPKLAPPLAEEITQGDST